MQKIQALSTEKITSIAPSILTTHAIDGVSDKYTFVSSFDAMMMIIGAGWIPYAADEAKVREDNRKGFQRHVIKFAREDMLSKSQNERFELVLYNSHDRATAFIIAAGILRFVCTNGLIVGEGVLSFRHKHIGFDQKYFIDSVNQIAEGSDLMSNKIDQFKTIEMKPDDINRYAWSAAELFTNEPKEISLYDMTKIRRVEDNKNDLWTVFNRTQENIIKGGIRRAGKTESGRPRKNTRRVQSIARDLKLNRALWDLTEKYALELA